MTHKTHWCPCRIVPDCHLVVHNWQLYLICFPLKTKARQWAQSHKHQVWDNAGICSADRTVYQGISLQFNDVCGEHSDNACPMAPVSDARDREIRVRTGAERGASQHACISEYQCSLGRAARPVIIVNLHTEDRSVEALLGTTEMQHLHSRIQTAWL